MHVHIEIEGVPVAWKAHGGYGRKSFNILWREKDHHVEKIRSQYNGQLLEGAVAIEYTFYMPIPKSISKKKRTAMIHNDIRPTKRPDIDNMQKFISDCLIGIVIKDDSQAVGVCSSKFYSENPRTVIRIYQ